MVGVEVNGKSYGVVGPLFLQAIEVRNKEKPITKNKITDNRYLFMLKSPKGF